MQSRRDYAVSLGLAKPGRGRMSAAAHEAINKALSEGMRFSDVSVSEDKPITSQEASKKNTEGTFFGDTPEPLYNGGWYVVEDGKRISVSGREVCRNCMNSLDYHRCSSPIFPAQNGEMLAVVR